MATNFDKCHSDGPTPVAFDTRDFSKFSDHVTVWIDKHIGEENAYKSLKLKFDNNIQVLTSNTATECNIDDESMLCENQNMLKKLSNEVYCLKYFSTIENGLEFINNNQEKQIFFVSSGTVGKQIIPEIANLSHIRGIYIFCGDISHHISWAIEYEDKITSMLEHEDNLLERLTRDIAEYVESKGDKHKENDERIPAINCYSWSIKLLNRAHDLGDTGTTRKMNKIKIKMEDLKAATQCIDEA